MAILTNFTVPQSAKLLALHDNPQAKLLVFFMASADPGTGQPWCPGVRAALPHIRSVFSADDAPEVALAEVGQKPQWKDPGNFYRTNWGIQFIPTLVRYQWVDGEVKEVARLVGEDDILDEKKLGTFVTGSS